MGYDHLCLQIGRCLRHGPRSVPQLAEELEVDPARIHYAIRQRLIGIYVTPARHDGRGHVTEWGLIRPWALVMSPTLYGGEVVRGGTVRLNVRAMILNLTLPGSSLANRFR